MNNDIVTNLYESIKKLIEETKVQVALSVNSSMSLLYWQIGNIINREILLDKRAEYGLQIVATLKRQLVTDYGVAFSEKNLRRMMQFAEAFPDETIVNNMVKHLSWSHIKELIPITDPLKKQFYIQMCIVEKWSVRTFRERIQSLLYERTAISKKPEQTIINELQLLATEEKISPDLVFKDPYFLDFLGLADSYSEKDLESALISEIQRFINELGSDFAFLARQKRITVDNQDYRIDLLFFHRRLKCLVVIELKIGDFEAGFKGQMELYLRYLDKYEKVDGENSPIGLILCTGKNEEHIELLQLDKSNIRVAEYLTILPPQKLLQDKLHQAIELAHLKLRENHNI